MIELLVFVYGALVGSFLNVCIYRMPRDLSVAKPARSFCPQCETPIPWYLNIPLVSYLWLRGKCASCKTKIPLRYLLVELTTALMYVGLWEMSSGSWILFGVRAIFMSMLLVLIFTDFETKLLPDFITIPGVALGLLFSLVPGILFPQELWYDRLLQSALGAVCGYGSLLVTGLIGNFLFKKDSMGGGDLKLMAMLGAFIGWKQVFFVFMLSPFVALPFALWYRLAKKDEQVPFGPFLAFWGGAFFLYGEFLSSWINKLYGF